MVSFFRQSSAFRALKHRNYRFYFIGQAISILGTWVQQVALSWLVYRLTGSATLLGLTAFLAQAPQLIIGPISGPWLDKHNRQRMLMTTQALLMLQAILLGVLSFCNLLETWHLIVLATMMGVFTSVDVPLRQSLLSQIVTNKEDVPNAIALNAALFNSARFLGPPIAGVLLTLTSETICFFINAASFLALILLAAKMQIAPTPKLRQSFGNALSEGMQYIFQHHKVKTLLFVVAILNITASAYVVLMPAFTREIYHGDAQLLGGLLGAAGAGALTSSIWLASRTNHQAILKIVLFGIWLTASALLIFSLTHYLPIALLSICAVGFGIALTNVASNSYIQLAVTDQLRGRVLSVYTAIRFGFDALGGLIAGAVASQIGVNHTLTVNAIILLLAACWYFVIYRTRLKQTTDN